MVVHDGQLAVEVRQSNAVDHGDRHPGRAREPGRGPYLSQRLRADGAGAREVVLFLTHCGFRSPPPAVVEKMGTGFRDAVKTFAEYGHSRSAVRPDVSDGHPTAVIASVGPRRAQPCPPAPA